MTDILIGRNDSASVSAPAVRHVGTKRRQSMIETMDNQMVRAAGSQLRRQILRGVLGGKR